MFFSFRGKKQEETAVEEETSEEPVQYEVKDLEPEQLDVNVEAVSYTHLDVYKRQI